MQSTDIRIMNVKWARMYEQKTRRFAERLMNVFQLHGGQDKETSAEE